MTAALRTAGATPLDAADVARLESIATSFARGFGESASDHPMSAARRRLLGPTTVWRTVRALTARAGLGERIADVGLRVSAGGRPDLGGAAPLARVDASATGCVIACALTAWRMRGDAPACLEVGPRCDLDACRAALGPLLESGDLSLREVDADPRRTRAIIAPYFYSPGDLRRVAEAIALERAVPCPHSEGELEVYVARGWAQRQLFGERLTTAAATLGGTPLLAVELDVDETTDLLEKVRHLPPTDAIAAFVYPMLRERPEVERALLELVGSCHFALINQTPAIAWALGRAASAAPLLLQADQRMRGVASPRAMSRRGSFEASPSVPGAVATLAWSWVG